MNRVDRSSSAADSNVTYGTPAISSAAMSAIASSRTAPEKISSSAAVNPTAESA